MRGFWKWLFSPLPFDVDRVVKAVLSEAERQRSSSAFPLIQSQLAREVEVFLAGNQGRLPKGWEPYLDAAERETSSEYKEYQRLKAKFCE